MYRLIRTHLHILLAPIFLIGFTLVGARPTWSDEDSKRLFYAAGDAFNTKDWDKCIALVRAGLKIEPRNAIAHYVLGSCLIAKGSDENILSGGDELQLVINGLPQGAKTRGDALVAFALIEDRYKALRSTASAVQTGQQIAGIYSCAENYYTREESLTPACPVKESFGGPKTADVSVDEHTLHIRLDRTGIYHLTATGDERQNCGHDLFFKKEKFDGKVAFAFDERRYISLDLSSGMQFGQRLKATYYRDETTEYSSAINDQSESLNLPREIMFDGAGSLTYFAANETLICKKD